MNRLSVPASRCICIDVLLVILLGVWGAYRDVHAASDTALRKEVATIYSHAVCTVGRIERGLEQEKAPVDLSSVQG